MSCSILSKTVAAVAFLAALTATADAGVDVHIDKTTQRMYVAVDGVTRYVWNVSTGAGGYETPSGSFRPFRMERDHFSRQWDNAPMPHSIFFTPVGHAIHGSEHVRSLGRPASHGCVRLAPEHAAVLYALVAQAGLENSAVSISGSYAAAPPGEVPGYASGYASAPFPLVEDPAAGYTYARPGEGLPAGYTFAPPAGVVVDTATVY
jgi:hypothetical protein